MGSTDSTAPREEGPQPESLVEYYGSGINFCGYCKRDGTEDSEGRRSYDMKAYRLTAEDYQQLLDRNWRRSGNYCYHPQNKTTCCPNFSISCDALRFKISRSQRRVIETLNTFLITGDKSAPKERVRFRYTSQSQSKSHDDAGDQRPPAVPHLQLFDKLKTSSKARDRRFVKSCERKVRLHGLDLEEAVAATRRKGQARRDQLSVDQPQSLEQLLYLNKTVTSRMHELEASTATTQHGSTTPLTKQFEIKLLHVQSAEIQALREKEHQLMIKYQIAVHKEDADDWTMDRFSDFLVKSPLLTEPMRDRTYLSPEDSRIKEGDSLSKNPDPNQQDNTVVRPPDLPTAYGTYHCVYLLEGNLIGVGVLDVLPKCVTTVYFFYDPDYAFLNLGIYSALVEISLVQRLARHYSGPPDKNRLVYYYMGFYVHECEKMHYKTRFRPSYLLCSETFRYVLTERCLEKLIGRKHARFAPESVIAEDAFQAPSIASIPVSAPVIEGKSMVDYTWWLSENLGAGYAGFLIERMLTQYVRLVGNPLASRLRLQVNSIHKALVDEHRRVTMQSEASVAAV